MFRWGFRVSGAVSVAVTRDFEAQGEERLLHRDTSLAAPSPCTDGERIHAYCGSMFVLGTGDELEIVARNRMGEGIVATPAVADDTLYLRTEGHLWAIADLSAVRD